MLTVVIGDDLGNELDVTFFSAYGHEGKLRPGVRGFFVGTIGAYGRRLQLTHPEYELFDDEAAGEAAVEWYRTHRVPVYSTTGKINSLQLRSSSTPRSTRSTGSVSRCPSPYARRAASSTVQWRSSSCIGRPSRTSQSGASTD